MIAASPPAIIRYVPPVAPKPDPDRMFLRAIREVESGDDSMKRGARGELGAYQFRQATWRRMTKAPFREAKTSMADTVALAHLQYLRGKLERLEPVGVTYWALAVAWNAGPSVFYKGRHKPESSRAYADRVITLLKNYRAQVI